MGCCFSKKNKIPTSPSPHTNFHEKSPPLESDTRNSPPSPPPLLQEETVKEVLPVSETPNPPSFPNPNPKPSFPNTEEKEEEERIEEKIPIFINGDDAASEFSEICSLSETISTLTIAEKKEEEKENSSPAKFRRKRSVSGDFPGRVPKSPPRRSDPLPVRRPAIREMGPTNPSRTPTGGRGFRRDNGEYSGRRSRSPATQKEVGQSPSGRKTGRLGRRNPTEMTEDGGVKVEKREEGVGASSASKESLENPLVSLECFIFL